MVYFTNLKSAGNKQKYKTTIKALLYSIYQANKKMKCFCC